jgi:hypothetical protein
MNATKNTGRTLITASLTVEKQQFSNQQSHNGQSITSCLASFSSASSGARMASIGSMSSSFSAAIASFFPSIVS